MSLRVNLADVSGDAFEPIPSGRYPLNVFDGELRTSESEEAKHPGSQYIAWEFIVAGGDSEGRHLWSNTMFSHGDCPCGDEENFNKSLFALKQLLSATGLWTEEELNADDFEFSIEEVAGSQVSAQVSRRESEQYGPQNTVKNYKRVEAGSVTSTVLP